MKLTSPSMEELSNKLHNSFTDSSKIEITNLSDLLGGNQMLDYIKNHFQLT